MDDYEQMAKYLEVKETTPMNVKKLAQTTHVHLIGFSMMFLLTGLIFSLTSYPVLVRLVFAPWPLFFQVIDIGCWWLGRLHPMLAQAIMITGGLVALGFAIHIVGGLFELLALRGRKAVKTPAFSSD
jgi:hypothetical protein